jgi:IS605 OrfB family transposase
MKRSDPIADWRTIIVPVSLSGAQYRLAHESCYKSALIWNGLVSYLREYWKSDQGDPDYKQLRAAYAAFDPNILNIHSQAKQAIVDDLQDAVSSYRKNKKNGHKARAPRHEKKYRPIVFTKGCGWRLTPQGKLGLSFGRGNARIILPVPFIADQRTGEVIDPASWGEMKLCWDMNARKFRLHIAVKQVSPRPVLCPAKLLVSDEGIINAHTTAVKLPNGNFEVSVVVGRYARAVKHRRNKAHSELAAQMAKCVKGSRRWKKLDRARKRSSATSSARLKDFNHKVSRVVANEAIKHDTGRIVVGDVRGIEMNSRAKKRANKDQRRRLSQWERGTQENYIGHKTGVKIEYVNEAYSSKTCPACLTRNRPSGRNYRCKNCNLSCHRDAVGAINIYQKVVFGAYTKIAPGTNIRVIYRRPVKLFQPRRIATNLATSGSVPRVAVSETIDSVVTTLGVAVAKAA